MLLRRCRDHVVAVPQPAHAWLAAQLADAWGNEDFARPAAGAEWRLAVALHDVGWADWEAAPARDPATGWPLEFRQVPPAVHVDLWRAGVARARLFGRMPALLVSRHADTIYSRHVDPAALATSPEANVVAAFLAEQHALQRALASSLAADPDRREAATPEAVEHARLALATLDEISLALCWGVDEPRQLVEVPLAPGRLTRLTLSPGPEPDTAVLDPWPFGHDPVTVRCDGRILAAPSRSDLELRQSLAEARAATVVATLRPR